MAVYYGYNRRAHLLGRCPGIRFANGLLCFQGASDWRNRLGVVGAGSSLVVVVGSLPGVVAGNLFAAVVGAFSVWVGAGLRIGLSF